MVWLRSLRPLMALLAGVLTLAGFRLSYGYVPSTAVLPAITTAFICAACMAQNNFRDRHHNRHFGRTLASDHPRAYLHLAVGLWFVAGLLTTWLALTHFNHAIIAATMIGIGLIYSEMRRMFIIQNLAVAVCSAYPVLFTVFDSPRPNALGLVFLGVAVIICGREQIKDMFDADHDRGYKTTLPVVLGVERTKFIAATLMMIGPLIIAGGIGAAFSIVCAEIFGLSGGLLAKSHRLAIPAINAGMIGFAIIFFVC